jgi:alpha-ketoglutarate-dependent taurine dioxygenase
MKVSKIPGLGRFGVFIDDIDFNHLSTEEWMEIGKIHLNSLVTIIRNTNLDELDYTKRMSQWGKPRNLQEYKINKKYQHTVPGFYSAAISGSNEIDAEDAEWVKSTQRMMLKNDRGQPVMALKVTGRKDEDGNPLGMFAEGELLWHSNESGNLTFTPAVSLLAKEGVVGSATGFLTTTDWYESQSESFRSELDEMVAVHTFTPGKINPGLREDQDFLMYKNMCPESGTRIPLVIKSPGGITGLHYSVNTLDYIKGMSRAQSQSLFDRINKELFQEKYIYDHWYKQNGDLCLFDNSITLHRRLGGIADRLCYRIQYDYTYLQDQAYMPYSHREFRKQYTAQIKDYANVMNDFDFKIPKTRWTDYLPSFT